MPSIARTAAGRRTYAACSAFRRALAAEPLNLRAHYNLAERWTRWGGWMMRGHVAGIRGR
jgi:hypothetical protein